MSDKKMMNKKQNENITEKLTAVLELPEIVIHDPSAEDIYKGEQQENDRLAPLHLALVDCVKALEDAEEVLNKLYDHNEAVRHAAVEHYGTLHSQALARLAEVLK